MLESGSFSSIGVAEAPQSKLVDEPHTILLMGGFDGFSWLSNLDSYSPSLDLMISLRPMTYVRSYASVTKLYGELYIFGGVDGNSWYNTGISCSVCVCVFFSSYFYFYYNLFL